MKKQGKKITALTVSAMLMLNMAATAVPVFAEGESKVYTHDGYTVEYTVKNEWTGNQNIEVTITNTGDDVLSGWAMGYNAFGEIGGLWNAKVYGHQGTEYILSSAGYNDELAPGQSTNFGYTLTGDKFKIPQNIVNCAERVDITEGYNVYYNITADFVDTYQAEMIIENTSDTDISAWQLSFDGNVTINDLWNGKLIENNNGSFKVKNSENNSVIAAGSSVSFNFGGTKNTETEPNLGYSEPVETLPPVPVVTDEFTEAETAAESAETDAANPETDPAETEIPSETVLPEITTVTEPVVMPVSEVVFSNYKLTGMVIPMEFDFEIDPEVDSDNDGLPDYLEKELGTDRYNADTDGDGLPDGYEYFTLGTDPKKADSDDNGISDADEDFDEDGLTNLEEYELGTDPFSKDTDHDGLSDYDEVKIHNTDPLKYDTDGDKVSDGDEVILGLDPNNPATFGYPDNEYTTVQTVGEGSSALDYINNIEDNPYSVTIEITAAGVADNNLTAGESGYSYSILQNDAVLGVVPEFDYSDGLSVTDVVIKFKIDDSAVEGGLGIFDEGGINRYGIFMYFEDTNTLLPIETFYDESTNSISTHVDRLGTVCIVDVEKWLNYLDTLPDEPYYLENDEKNEPGNVVFCIDTRLAADAANFENVKSDIKVITEDVFERYDDIKVYVYYQEFGMNFRAKNNLLYDKDGKDYFTSYETAAEAIDNMAITKKSFSYDLVEATNFMIDTCDENLLAIYHITDNGKVVGSIDDAKQLVQTVKNSKYTQKKDEKEINRIYVSLICLNGQIDNKSYINDLVDTSMGMIYTGENSIESEVEPADYSIMTLDLASANTDEQSGTVKSTNGKNTNIYGDGKDLNFFLLLTSTRLKDIRLKTSLNRADYYLHTPVTDSDGDGLSDWNEVDIATLCKIMGTNPADVKSLKYDELPALSVYQDYYDDYVDHSEYSYEYVKKGIGMVQAQSMQYFDDVLESARILPVISDPTMIDSDGDKIPDCIKFYDTEEYKNHKSDYYVTEFDDPNPLKFEYLWQWPALDKDNGNKLTRIAAGLEDDRTPPHGAIDIGALGIHHNAVASADGVVIDTYNNYYKGLNKKKNCGNYVFIMHEIKGVKYFSRYIHLETVNVEIGDEVHAGDIIGKIGGTGKSDTNTSDQYFYHLDFQIGIIDSITKLKDGTYSYVLKLVIDPLIFNYEYDKDGTKEITRKTYDMLINIPKNIDHTCTGGEEYFDDSGNKQNYSCHDCLKLFNCQEYFIHMEEVHNEVSNDYNCNDHCIKCRYKL